MQLLAETQSRLRDALVEGNASRLEGLLVGGRDAARRFAIHQRHYQSSLTRALLVKFPATAWLVGTPALERAARDFVRAYPPRAPCIAEYADAFPRFVAERSGAASAGYVAAFGELEWHLGQVSISIDAPAVTVEQLSQYDTDTILDSTLTLQPGLRYLGAAWPVDDLMKLYLTETAPHEYPLEPADVCLEIRGTRGWFDMNRLDAAEFAFR